MAAAAAAAALLRRLRPTGVPRALGGALGNTGTRCNWPCGGPTAALFTSGGWVPTAVTATAPWTSPLGAVRGFAAPRRGGNRRKEEPDLPAAPLKYVHRLGTFWEWLLGCARARVAGPSTARTADSPPSFSREIIRGLRADIRVPVGQRAGWCALDANRQHAGR